MNRFIVLLLASLLALPTISFAAPTIEELQKQIADIVEELDDLNDRLEKPERHSALDRISFSGDLRTTADSLHYQDITFNPGIKVDFDAFSADMMAGTFSTQLTDAGGNGLTFLVGDPGTNSNNIYQMLGGDLNPNANQLTPLTQMMLQNSEMVDGFMAGQLSGVMPFALAQAAQTSDINNDIMYTTRLRLNMKADIASNMNFSGRLNMYKAWGDSSGSRVFDSWDAFAMDGTSSGQPSGDTLHVERAFFNWKDIAGSDFYFSVGRRPSTYGPPSNYRENELRGGTPSGHLVNFNFDGFTIGYHLSEITGMEGQSVRFCYGQGFESEYGNGSLFNGDITSNLDDTHLGGFNIDVFNDGKTLVQATLFRAQDVVDGFTGVFAFPTQFAELFAGTLYTDMQKFSNMNFNVRYTPSTVIGNINLIALGLTREEDNGINWFASFGMTQLESNGEAGMFGGMGTDAVFEAQLSDDGSEIYMMPARAEDDDTQEGYGVYVGIQVPAPMGKFGLEYNYGSKYWTPFTQAQDDLVGSKLSTRGHVGEVYYIFDINPRAFIKIGGLYYDYEYTGSGSPVGKPVKVSDVQDGEAYSLLPVVDTAWDAYAKITMQF
ncbi:Protein of unknown function [Desulfuromusa kysingii]|uniref:DUF3373 domain-containing protein n=1 Tax=Desulfuromusa kysingii TaxID=37625 RepID=A0A1H3WAI1_9BACT|nr:DUF3373 family protein [Desulfuromusa kysingii]SDZ83990.1 Protein of unknown function [Desulfuromusa kysingii]